MHYETYDGSCVFCRDMPNIMTRVEFDPVFPLDEIVKHAPQKITVLESSGKEGHGLAEVTHWIKEHAE